MDKKIFLPGEYITTIEEFFAGLGVFEEKGKIYACAPGLLKTDLKERKVDLELIKKPKSFVKKGDVVIAQVKDVGRNVVELTLLYNETEKIEANIEAFMLIKRSKEAAMRSIKPTDIIRAHVLEAEGKIILSIRGKDFGILYAECPFCLKPLYYNEKEYSILKCLNCGFKVKTKVSSLYLNKY
ncbi:MAG: exosome complex RNA-binding protein Csl4 [Thermoproteota archaeon]|jgi:exosome complex RNA-binding protein Csl4|nr:exosome complex RNA-binding protein Csl4 [Thermoproteota archaeon]